MKYIVFTKRGRLTTIHVPVVFPNMLVHADVAKMLTCDIGPLAGYKADSAGECSTFGHDFMCHGESTTLKIKSKPDRDKELLRMADYGGLMF